MISERCLWMFDLDGHEGSAVPNLLAGRFFFNKTLNFSPTFSPDGEPEAAARRAFRFLIHTVDIEACASRSSCLQNPQNPPLDVS